VQLFSRHWMDETQFCGMQSNPGCPRTIHDIAARRRRVDPFTTNRVATFRQMDANLMGPPRLKPTLDQRVGIAEMLNRPHVSHCPLPLTAVTGPPPAIAPISNQVGDDGTRADPANSDGKITPLGCVLPELLSQNPAGRHGASEDKQSASLAVDTMYGTNGSPPDFGWGTGRPLGSAAAGLPHLKPANYRRQQFIECRLDLSPTCWPARLLMVAGGGDPRGLVDHHDSIIKVNNSDIPWTGRGCCCHIEQFDNIAGLESSGCIGAKIAVDGHPSPADQLLGCCPTFTRLLTKKGCQGASRRRLRNMKKLSVTAACHRCIPLKFQPVGNSRTERPASERW
jgi:hypothetical protein